MKKDIYIYHQPSEKFLQAICRPECLIMGPVKAPSIDARVPLHLTTRRLFSFPMTLKVIAEEMGKVVRGLEVDAVAALEMSGIPIATAISIMYDIPMVIVRKEKREGARFSVEGITREGWRYALIDDTLSGGAHKQLAVQFLEETGGRVSDIVVIMNAYEVQQAGYDLGRSWIEERGIHIHYFTSWLLWFQAMHQFGHLSKELYEIMEDVIHNLRAWQDDEEKWAWFERVKQAQKGKFV